MMTQHKTSAELTAIARAAIENLMTTTDEDLTAEAKADGIDLSSMSLLMKASMRETAASAMRARMKEARTKSFSGSNEVRRPSIDSIKQLVQGLFAANPSLRLAFREGKRQSDADWTSLYDDLVALGAIKPDNP